jgi:hypothetical protein
MANKKKYSLQARIGDNDLYEEIATFADIVSHSALQDCAEACLHNSRNINAVRVIDNEEDLPIFSIYYVDEPFDDNVDESNYDPYLGQDIFSSEDDWWF